MVKNRLADFKASDEEGEKTQIADNLRRIDPYGARSIGNTDVADDQARAEQKPKFRLSLDFGREPGGALNLRGDFPAQKIGRQEPLRRPERDEREDKGQRNGGGGALARFLRAKGSVLAPEAISIIRVQSP